MNSLTRRSLASFAFVAATAPCFGQTLFVTTVADVSDFTGSKTVADLPGPDGKVSMREACIAANNTPGPQTIGFHIPAGQWGTGVTGPVIINAGQSFPVNDNATTIDGTTQTAFTGDTNPNGAEVSFHSTVIDPPLIQSGTFAVKGDGCILIGLGDMDGRNYGIDLQPQAQDCVITRCVIKGVFAAIRVQGDHNTIGGTSPGDGNRLTSLADGLRIQGLTPNSADSNLVFGNVLTGEGNGVQIVGNATQNQIGGFQPGEGNLISGAGYLQEDGTPDGAMVRIESNGNFVYGNLIGTDPTGTLPANDVGDVGIEIYGDGNVVRKNVIGGITGLTGFLSVQAGIALREGAENNVIAGNWIGVDATGTIAIPNHVGIDIGPFDASLPAPAHNIIGGAAPADANLIASNEAGGIVVRLNATENEIMGNSIHSNHATGAIGIDLGADGPTANDTGDGDAGPNDLLNSPVLHSAVATPASTVVLGSLDTPSPSTCSVELFVNPAPIGNEVVEAKTSLGRFSPLPDGSFVLVLPADYSGLAITATATDAQGSTSEIGGAAIATASPWLDLGHATVGSAGTPRLVGAGTLDPNTEVGLGLESAKPLSTALLVLGSTAANIPVLGTVLVPSPTFVVALPTDSQGRIVVHGNWPGAPTGTKLYAQYVIVDPGTLFGVTFSNAVVGTSP